MRTTSLQVFALSIVPSLVAACSATAPLSPPMDDVGGATSEVATGGSSATEPLETGGTHTATGGATHASTGESSGGAATGGNKASGGAATGGNKATGGAKASGGAATGGEATGGKGFGGGLPLTGGQKATGGVPQGSGGAATGGKAFGGGGAGAGGKTAGGGVASTGGNKATGGQVSTSPQSTTVDCSAAMPTSGGTQHSPDSRGGSGNLAWEIWNNGSGGSMTTYSVPAFSATWNNSGDFLARIGLEWGNSGKPYSSYGVIKAQYTYTKTGSGGGYSYIGVYGWSTNPCVEYYILDDSYGSMPFTPYGSSGKGSATMIDGENYKFFSNRTNGTGGSRCSGVSSWDQHWSVRQKARQCGTITISDHFKAWDAAGMKLGTMLEAKILLEVGGGQGSVNFPIANVSAE